MPPIEPVTKVEVPAYAKKPFSWSYSKLKNYQTCPRRHYHLDLLKDVQEEESEEILWGNKLHSAMASRLSNGIPLQAGMEGFEGWAQRVEAAARPHHAQILVEQKLAINRAFGGCAFFDRAAWYRAVADVLVIIGPVAFSLDWKTGRRKEDSVQLVLTAACIFAAYPQVQAVRTEFVWLKEKGHPSSRTDVKRTDMPTFWNRILPQVKPLEEAHLAPVSESYPPKPSGLCRLYCPVRSCEYCGGE